ncbi:hypothetical protein [Brevundimonas sp.]|uniref:hypothetical protein n=1 Tax=Brevundimonas sp. TaxID=1871086 RepID=UPI0035B452F2
MQFSRALAGGVAALLAASAAGSAGAGQAPNRTPERASEARGVVVCAQDAASRRAFVRRYGERPVFITAREAREVRRDAPAWEAPRCMTEQERVRYERAVALARTADRDGGA